MSKAKGKLNLFSNNAEIILSKEDNEVFSDDSRPIEFLNKTTGTIKTKIEVEPQVSVYDVMKSWYGLQQKNKDEHERFYGYYFDEATDTTYGLAGVYISSITGVDSDSAKEIILAFNYDDKEEIYYPKEADIDAFFETYITIAKGGEVENENYH